MAFTISMTSVFAFFAFQACKNQFNIDVFMTKTNLQTDHKSQEQYFHVKNGMDNQYVEWILKIIAITLRKTFAR